MRTRRREAFDETARDGSPYRLRLVAHDPQAYDWYYNVVSNPTLWFLQHYLWDLTGPRASTTAFTTRGSTATCRSTRAFADAVLDELDRDPTRAVFFHDYHLYLAPRFVRDAHPDARLAHFVHIPWPQTDYWHVLPLAICARGPRRPARERRRRLPHATAGGATSCARRGHRRRRRPTGRATHRLRGPARAITAAPISVDPSEFDELAQSDAVLAAGRRSRERVPRSSILRVDRTDPSKNVVRGFRAFELYLDAHPEMHGRVKLLALLDPSRQEIPEYAEYVGAIQREARRVNYRFQQDGWTPIDLQISDNFPQAVAAYKDSTCSSSMRSSTASTWSRRRRRS